MTSCLLFQLLQQPQRAADFTPRDWDLALRQARQANVLSAVDAIFEERNVRHLIPEYVLTHLRWANTLAEKHSQAVRYEVEQICSALSDLCVDIILLKGAAYVQGDFPPAKGRLFSDVDIMVDKTRLNEVEASLMLHGWISGGFNGYDQYYYRRWMHELPPMQHSRRLTTIDVHHAILPQTAAARPDPRKLIENTVVIDQARKLRVLAPVDMVLHSATHLFYDGEFDNGLRDLIDLHRLVVHFGHNEGFWDDLCDRAAELDLGRPLFYTVRYLRRILQAHVPEHILDVVQIIGAPSRWRLAFMDSVFLRAFLPKHSSCSDPFVPAARAFVYARANWLRMPPVLLAAHLSYKAFIAPFSQRKLRRDQQRLRSLAEDQR